MSKHPITLYIPQPCSQAWDDMVPDGRGRHCDSCQTTVIDFTTWSDAELYHFFAKNRAHVCGRYLASQIDRPLAIPPQPHSRLYQLFVALGLTLVFAPAAESYGQSTPLKTNVSRVLPYNTVVNHTPTQFFEIKGVVTDGRIKEPLVNASIKVSKDSIAMGGAVSDFDGIFSVKPLEAGSYRVEISYPGFKTVDTFVAITNADISIMVPMGQNATQPEQQKQYILGATIGARNSIRSLVATEIRSKPVEQYAYLELQQLLSMLPKTGLALPASYAAPSIDSIKALQRNNKKHRWLFFKKANK